MISGCPTFSNTGSGETLINSNRQQDYKAYSLGIFRGKCSGFFRFYDRGITGFHKSHTLKMSSFDKFYIPNKAGFGRLSPDMLGFVRFLSPEKMRFYEVL